MWFNQVNNKERCSKAGGQRSSVWSHARFNVGSTWQIVSVAFWVAWWCRLALAVFFTTPPSLPFYFSTDLFSVTGVWAVCGGSWLVCGDCQPWERYFSSGALAPNLHKAMQLLTVQKLNVYTPGEDDLKTFRNHDFSIILHHHIS